MAMTAASIRTDGGRHVRDTQGFRTSKWAPAPRDHMDPALQPTPRSARRIIGLTHNYDVPTETQPRNQMVPRRVPPPPRPQEVAPPMRAPPSPRGHPEEHADLREREYIDEETFSHIEHVPIRIKERVVHHTREVPRAVAIPKYIEVPKPYPVDRIVEVPKYIEKRVEIPVEVERIVEVPKPYPVEVIKRVEVPVEIERIVEKVVPVDRPVHVERRVEVPVHMDVVHEVERPVRDAVPVHVADPRQADAIADLQRQLYAAHEELERVRGGHDVEVIHRGTTHHDRAARSHGLPHDPRGRHSRQHYPGPMVPQGTAPYMGERELSGRGVSRRSLHDPHHHRLHPHEHHIDDVVGMNGRMPVDDALLHQHPTEKWGRQHDIPGRRVRW